METNSQLPIRKVVVPTLTAQVSIWQCWQVVYDSAGRWYMTVLVGEYMTVLASGCMTVLVGEYMTVLASDI